MFKFYRLSGVSYNRNIYGVNGTLILLVLALYLLNRLVLKDELSWSFLSSHFNDVLAGLLLLPSYNLLALLFRQSNLLMLRCMNILTFTLVVGLFWEYVTPLYRSDSVSDPLDILAYLLGGLIYWLLSLLVGHKALNSKPEKKTGGDVG
jgi:hypothetical protein